MDGSQKRILICGLNGVGKSTLGRAVAAKMGIPFLDAEDIYYDKTDNLGYPYQTPRTQKDQLSLLSDFIAQNDRFVFASVTGRFGEVLQPDVVICIELPREQRLQRVYARSFDKFGEKMSKGGAFYEQVQAFHRFVESREERLVKDWLKTISCPVILVDGSLPVEENAAYLKRRLQERIES